MNVLGRQTKVGAEDAGADFEAPIYNQPVVEKPETAEAAKDGPGKGGERDIKPKHSKQSRPAAKPSRSRGREDVLDRLETRAPGSKASKAGHRAGGGNNMRGRPGADRRR